MRITVNGVAGALKAVFDLSLKVEEQVEPDPVIGEHVHTLEYLTATLELVEWVYNGEKVDLNDGAAEFTVS